MGGKEKQHSGKRAVPTPLVGTQFYSPVWYGLVALLLISCRDQICHVVLQISNKWLPLQDGMEMYPLDSSFLLFLKLLYKDNTFPLRTGGNFSKAPKAKSTGSPLSSILLFSRSPTVSAPVNGLDCRTAGGKINGIVSPSASKCDLQTDHIQQGRICQCLSYDGTLVRDSPVSDFHRTLRTT